jgi:hypothetical protein
MHWCGQRVDELQHTLPSGVWHKSLCLLHHYDMMVAVDATEELEATGIVVNVGGGDVAL